MRKLVFIVLVVLVVLITACVVFKYCHTTDNSNLTQNVPTDRPEISQVSVPSPENLSNPDIEINMGDSNRFKIAFDFIDWDKIIFSEPVTFKIKSAYVTDTICVRVTLTAVQIPFLITQRKSGNKLQLRIIQQFNTIWADEILLLRYGSNDWSIIKALYICYAHDDCDYVYAYKVGTPQGISIDLSSTEIGDEIKIRRQPQIDYYTDLDLGKLTDK